MFCEINYSVLQSLIEDPSQTQLLFEIIKFTGKSSYSTLVETMVEPLQHNQDFINLSQKNYQLGNLNFNYLKSLPEDTLGYQYVNFLEQNNLQPDYYPPIKKRNLLNYIKALLWESHDIWHVVCGYGKSLRDEAALQAFLLAQIQSPLALLMLGTILIHTAVKKPKEIAKTMDLVVFGYQQGKLAKNLLSVNWHLFLTKSLYEVRQELNIHQIAAMTNVMLIPTLQPLTPNSPTGASGTR